MSQKKINYCIVTQIDGRPVISYSGSQVVIDQNEDLFKRGDRAKLTMNERNTVKYGIISDIRSDISTVTLISNDFSSLNGIVNSRNRRNLQKFTCKIWDIKSIEIAKIE